MKRAPKPGAITIALDQLRTAVATSVAERSKFAVLVTHDYYGDPADIDGRKIAAFDPPILTTDPYPAPPKDHIVFNLS